MGEYCSYKIPLVKDLTFDEQRKMFNVGDKVYVRPNGRDFTRSWGSNMNNMINKSYNISYIKTFLDAGYPKHQLHLNVKPNDLIIYLTDERRSSYYFHYKSLFHPRQRVPDYKPRKYIKI